MAPSVSLKTVVSTKVLMHRRENARKAKAGRWRQAYELLQDEEKRSLETFISDKSFRPLDLLDDIRIRKEFCRDRQWVAFTKENGEKVRFRDLLEGVIIWVNRFIAVGDVIVNYDPAHVALPWAAIRFILQVSMSDIQMFGRMIEGLENVSRVIALYAEVERDYLRGNSALKSQLSAVVVRLYSSVLKYLAAAREYYGQRTLRRKARGIFIDPEALTSSYLNRIRDEESETFKLSMFVRNEDEKNLLMSNFASIRKGVEGLHASLENSGKSMEERRRRLVQWLGAIFSDDKFGNILKERHPKSCDWMLSRAAFRDWEAELSVQPRVLWVHGPPGFGKSVLAARLVDYLIRTREKSTAFFFVSDSDASREPIAILRSWIAQLIRLNDNAVPIAERLFVAKSEGTAPPTVIDLWGLFKDLTRAIMDATFVVDGFDECTAINSALKYDTSDARSQFLNSLMKTVAQSSARILIVSRDLTYIRNELGPDILKMIDISAQEYAITASDTQEDITSFSRAIFQEKLRRKTPEFREELSEQASEKCQGMFLWLRLLQKQIKPGVQDKVLRRTISEMPRGVNNVYEEELVRIMGPEADEEQKQRAIAILRWILFAIRPLTVGELTEALILTFDDGNSTLSYPADDLPDAWNESLVDEDYVNYWIREPCGSLIELRSSQENEALASHTVHFVHFSVKEFLLGSGRAGRLRAEDFYFQDPKTENDRLATLCLQYLCYDVFGTEDDDEAGFLERMKIYPFLFYAARSWYEYALSGKETVAPEIVNYACKLLDPSKSNWRIWAAALEKELMDAEQGTTNYDGGQEVADNPDPGSPLYYASLLGITEVVSALLERGLSCTAEGGRYGFPLQAAAARSRSATVRFLLDHGADVCQSGGFFGSALAAAAAMSTEEMVNVLLDAGADIYVKNNGRTPLHYACQRGALGIAKTLALRGLECEAVDHPNARLLVLACDSKNLDMVKWLLDQGLNLNSQNSQHASPLILACRQGSDEIVELLIQREGDVDLHGPGDLTALHFAVIYEHDSVVKLLLDAKSCVDLCDDSGWTALHYAAMKIDPIYAKLLLEHNADLEVITDSGTTPLHIAAFWGRDEVIELLLTEGADLEAEDETWWRPLHHAVQNNKSTSAEAFLRHGANLYARNLRGMTPFDVALEGGYTTMMRLLVENGACRARTREEPMAQDDEDHLEATLNQPLYLAVVDNDLEQVKELMKHPSDNMESSEGVVNDCLLIAAAFGAVETAQYLLSRDANPDCRALGNARTPLHYAVLGGSMDLTKVLLERCTDISAEDARGFTVLSAAVTKGLRNLDIVELLLSESRLNTFGDENTSRAQRDLPVGYDSCETVVETTTFSPPSDVIKAIGGPWRGTYTYRDWYKGREEPFGFDIRDSDVFQKTSCSVSFVVNGSDLLGAFKILGEASNVGKIWWTKLYEKLGWLYAGDLSVKEGKITGQWGSNWKLWHGSFELEKAADSEVTTEVTGNSDF